MSSTGVFRGCIAVAGVSLALLLPAQAQFWGDWGNRPQRQQQWNNNWFGGGGWNDRRYYGQRQEREGAGEYLRGPAPARKKAETTPPTGGQGRGNDRWRGDRRE